MSCDLNVDHKIHADYVYRMLRMLTSLIMTISYFKLSAYALVALVSAALLAVLKHKSRSKASVKSQDRQTPLLCGARYVG